jgi:hypothetical protein
VRGQSLSHAEILQSVCHHFAASDTDLSFVLVTDQNLNHVEALRWKGPFVYGDHAFQVTDQISKLFLPLAYLFSSSVTNPNHVGCVSDQTSCHLVFFQFAEQERGHHQMSVSGLSLFSCLVTDLNQNWNRDGDC